MLHGDRQHTAKYRGVARNFRARCSAKEGSWMHSKPCIDLSAPVAASQEYILEVIASGMAVRNVDEHEVFVEVFAFSKGKSTSGRIVGMLN